MALKKQNVLSHIGIAVLLFSACRPPVGPLPEDSIYQSNGVFFDENEKQFHLRDLRGETVVLSMVYMQCKFACPLIVSDMKKIEAACGTRQRQHTRFVAVSFDPQRDDANARREFRKKMNLDDRWLLVSGADADLRELATMLGFSYSRGEKGEFLHSSAIFGLDQNGRIVARRDGSGGDPQEFANKLE